MVKFTIKYLIFAPTYFGPDGPKHIVANIRYFNCKFYHFICLIKGAFVGEKEFWRYQNAQYNNKKIKKLRTKIVANSDTSTVKILHW
jgi:hypothetical protein